ncbi:MAG: hypothetical protein EOO06_08865 [Chitinophagaceae bacterium]|nr:MAG: hypothetical protein EOO06_08865 [Chitinophagaceae bacterium]
MADTHRESNPVLEWIFYGNFFYGFCAVALAVEAVLQLGYPLNGWAFYCMLFLCTVLYYNYPYARKYNYSGKNPRTAWYAKHYRYMFWNQVIVSLILLAGAIIFLVQFFPIIKNISCFNWFLVGLFPLVAGLYYGLNFLSARYNLRSIGWLKPFIIGFTWAGLVTVYPVLWQNIQAAESYKVVLFNSLLFIKNGMFVAVLCIMFDIKDYATDHSSKLKTFVVQLGLRKTIFYLLIPLPILGVVSFLSYAFTHQFSAIKIVMNMIPFLLLLAVGFALRKRRSMLYYHVVIDGLMLVKAACGITAMLLSEPFIG